MTYQRRRNIVLRPDGKRVNVARFRGQLFVCSLGCCCGRTEDGFAEVPNEHWHREWERRKLRNIVHLTQGGCLGPCGLANVVLLLFDSQAVWFHSINSDHLVDLVYDHIDRLLAEGTVVSPAPPLDQHLFTGTSWQPRPDGQPVDDFRPRRDVTAWSSHGSADVLGGGGDGGLGGGGSDGGVAASGTVTGADGHACPPKDAPALAGVSAASVDRAVALMEGVTALPRKNGELVFDEPWHGRAFGMAVALHEQGAYEWEAFRQELIGQIREMEQRGGKFVYYEAWLAALERVLAAKGAVETADLDEVTYQFEYGERDDVY